MAVILTDQVVCPDGVTVAGVVYACGDVLPARTGSTARAALRAAGMLRPVTLAGSVTDLAGQALAAAVADPQVIVTADLADAYAAMVAALPAADSPPAGNPPPAASFTYTPASPSTGSNVTFDGSGSTPGAAPIVRYDWALGPTATRTGVTVTWRLPSGHGDYTVTLTVTAADDQTVQAAQVITI